MTDSAGKMTDAVGKMRVKLCPFIKNTKYEIDYMGTVITEKMETMGECMPNCTAYNANRLTPCERMNTK